MNITNLDRRGFLRLGGSAALLAASASLLSSCSSPSASGNASASSSRFPLGSTKLQALGGGLCVSPSYIAKDKGFWADEGIDVQLVSGSFQQSKDGLASGEYLVTNGDFQFFPAAEQGLDIKLIGGLHQGCIKLLVPPNSPVTTVAGLKGKKIGVDEVGGSPWAITSIALSDAGINPAESAGEVTFAPYDLSTLQAVATRGEVDAIGAWDPFGTTAEQAGFRTLVDIGSHPLFAGRFCCFLYASGNAYAKRPDAVAALLRGWYRAVEWVAANPDETVRIITDATNHEAYVASTDKALLVKLLNSYHYLNHHDAASLTTQAHDDALYFAQALKKVGYLSANLDAQKFADNLVAKVNL